MKLETNHLPEVMESCKHNILLMLVRFAAAMKNVSTSNPRAIKVCVNIPAAAAIPVVVCCKALWLVKMVLRIADYCSTVSFLLSS